MKNKFIFNTVASILIISLVYLISTPIFKNLSIEILGPTPEFSGVKLNSKLKDIKSNNNILCSDPGKEILKARDYTVITCEDKSYRANIYGIETSSRNFLFINDELAKIKISSIDYENNESAFLNLIPKVNSGYKKIKLKEQKHIWNIGKGNTLSIEEHVFDHPKKQSASQKLKSTESLSNCKSKDFLDCLTFEDFQEMTMDDGLLKPTQSRFIEFTIETANNPK